MRTPTNSLETLPRDAPRATEETLVSVSRLIDSKTDAEPKQSWLVVAKILGALVVLIGISVWGYWRYAMLPPEEMLHGIVEVQEIRLASKIGGRVSKVLTTEGTIAEKGQLLVELEAPELLARIASLRAQLRSVEAQLEQAKNGPLPESIESAKATVAISEARLANLISGTREEEIAQAESDVSVHQEIVQVLEIELDRLKALRTSNAISQSEWDQAFSNWKQSTGRLTMARERLRLLRAGARKESIDEARAELQLRKAELALVLHGTRKEMIEQLNAQVAEVSARIDEAQASLSESQVHAPGKCHVEVVSVRPGDIVAPNQPLIRVRLPEDRWVKAFVPETELGRIQVGQSVEVTHDGSSHRFQGTISFIASTSEFTPRNVQSINERKHQVFAVKVVLDDEQQSFKSGMAARVYLKPKATDETTPRP